METHVSKIFELAASREDISISMEHGLGKMLSTRMESPLCKVNGLAQGSGLRDLVNGEEAVSSTTAKLPLVEKIPPYTTWMFLDRFVLSCPMVSSLSEHTLGDAPLVPCLHSFCAKVLTF